MFYRFFWLDIASFTDLTATIINDIREEMKISVKQFNELLKTVKTLPI